MTALYPPVPPRQADAPDYVYLRRLTEIRSPHLLVTGIVQHAHGWELAVALESSHAAEHHCLMVHRLCEQMALLTGRIQEAEERARQAEQTAADAEP